MKWFLIFLLFSPILGVADTNSFTLEEVQQYALKNNREIESALLGIEAADKQVWEVTASGFPQIEINASYNRLVDIPTQLIPGEFFGEEPGTFIPVKFGTPHNANFGVSVSQLIFSGSYFVGVQASRIYRQLSEQTLKRTWLEIKSVVTETYYLILVAEENRHILAQSLENIKKTQFEIGEMYKEGFMELTDVKQLQISVNSLETGIRNLDQQIEIAYRLLKLQMGLSLDEPIVLSDELTTFLDNLDLTARFEFPFNPLNNINLKSVITQEKLAGLSLKNERTTFLPTLAAFASIQRDAQRNQFDIFDFNKKWFPTTVVGVQMSWPIFSGSSKLFRIQKAGIELDQARLAREQVEEGLKVQYRQARSKLSESHDRYINSRSNRDLALEVYEITLEKYREGLISSLELTQGHNQYLNAEQDYLQAVSDVLNARTELDKLLETL
jgi:outer membrane protein TolC